MDDRFAMRRLGRKSGFQWLAVLVSVGLFLLPGLAQSDEPDAAAVAFGSFPAVWGARLSPDGKRIVYLRMHESDLPVAEVFDIEKKQVNIVAASKRHEYDVNFCHWANNDRLLCSFYAAYKDRKLRSLVYPVTRLVGVNADGSQMEILLEKKMVRSGVRYPLQDKIIDYLPDRPDEILIALPSRRYGSLGVALLNIYSGAVSKKERSKSGVGRWMSDSQGDIRVRKRGREWQVRAPGGRKWKRLNKTEGTNPVVPAYTPLGFGDGANELFVAKPHEGRLALWAEDLGGEKPDRLIFSHPEVDFSSPLVLGKNRRLVAVEYTTDRSYYHFFDERLASIHEKLTPLFPDQGITISDESWDGRYYLVQVESDTSPGALFRFDAEKNELLRFVDQYPKLKDRSLASMESLEYPARDGTMIPGYVTMPAQESDGPRPTVILPHGGPHSRDVWGYDWLAQYLAARGYLVLQMNYRGSSGYGDEWLGEGGFRDWRTTVNDITDGARYLVETGQADPERMCIVGGSYGGYAALLSGIEEPDLYRCVVSIAGVSDLDALIDHWKKFGSRKSALEYIGSNPEILKAGSPLRRAKEMGAPTLLFHGDEDMNVEIAHSEKMNKALKKAGKEVTFIEYEEVEHSLRRNAVRIDMLDRMGEFLDTHTQSLPPPPPRNDES